MTTTEINGTIYKSQIFKVNGFDFTILSVTGKYNYVSVIKKGSFNKVGREFKNFDDAICTYKSADMKVALLMAENNLKQMQ
jgi:hypothetical protein